MMMSNDIMEYSFQSKYVVGAHGITMPVPICLTTMIILVTNMCVLQLLLPLLIDHGGIIE